MRRFLLESPESAQITKLLSDFTGMSVDWCGAEIAVKIDRRTRARTPAAHP